MEEKVLACFHTFSAKQSKVSSQLSEGEAMQVIFDKNPIVYDETNKELHILEE